MEERIDRLEREVRGPIPDRIVPTLEQFDEFVVMNELQVERMNHIERRQDHQRRINEATLAVDDRLREDVNMNLARIDNLDGTIAHHLDNYEFHAHDPESGRLVRRVLDSERAWATSPETEELVEEPDSSTDVEEREVIDLSDDDPVYDVPVENAVPIPIPGPQYPMVLIEEEDLVVPATPEVEEIDPIELALGMVVVAPRQVSVVQDYQAEEEAQAAEVYQSADLVADRIVAEGSVAPAYEAPPRYTTEEIEVVDQDGVVVEED